LRWSNFWKYFTSNFEYLGLKKLIATHYEDDAAKESYALIVEGDINGDGKIDCDDMVKMPMRTNGDFRSDESIAYLKEADVVVTNPPFSLFGEYIAQLMTFDKKFLIIGNAPIIVRKDIFNYIKEDTLWYGISPRSMKFKQPDGTIKAVNAVWFTNLDHPKRHEIFVGYKTYLGNESDYPKYDNYDAIEVSKAKDIPTDYMGAMGVPITFFQTMNRNQFELIGITEKHSLGQVYICGNKKYTRMIIKRK